MRCFITGMGMVSPLGNEPSEILDVILKRARGIKPLTLFVPGHSDPLPVAECLILSDFGVTSLPRTHLLALEAAKKAIQGSNAVPDAIVLGITTGGMASSEHHFKANETNAAGYEFHSPNSVTERIAQFCGCMGSVITIATACSSGTAALLIALAMLRTGQAKNILAGGADSLCKLTYYGFKSLQAIDPTGARPLDLERRGMSVAEGAAMLLLTADETPPNHAIAEILGGGLSCDAYHPTAPHPQGKGALASMKKAIQDAGIKPSDIDYINLHGTGTIENDLSESRALHALFSDALPPLSSTKGAFGHSLAGSGAIEAVLCALSIRNSVVPSNVGYQTFDPILNIEPVREPLQKSVRIALSNSFGFGGNNASIVIGSPLAKGNPVAVRPPNTFSILGTACFTGAGNKQRTMENLISGKSCTGMTPISEISDQLDGKAVRRLKRLARIVLALGTSAHRDAGKSEVPNALFVGTGWGPLTETDDFFKKLFASDEQYTSPTDFAGSVHNAPAGHTAMMFGATGANITATGGDLSFEQALLTATVLQDTDSILLIGADEYHEKLSNLFDPSVRSSPLHSDGGGALMLSSANHPSFPSLSFKFFQASEENQTDGIQALIRSLTPSAELICERYGGIFVSIPLAQRSIGEAQLNRFVSVAGCGLPVIDYRKFFGEFATVSAVGVVIATECLKLGKIPGRLCDGKDRPLNGRGLLMIGFGGRIKNYITAMEVLPGIS